MEPDRDSVQSMCSANEFVAIEAVKSTLMDLTSDKAIETLRTALPTIKVRFARQLCLVYLGYLGCSEIESELSNEEHSAFPINLAAMVAMAHLGSQQARLRTIELLQNGDEIMRHQLFGFSRNCNEFQQAATPDELAALLAKDPE